MTEHLVLPGIELIGEHIDTLVHGYFSAAEVRVDDASMLLSPLPVRLMP